jgi:hypothetical protein
VVGEVDHGGRGFHAERDGHQLGVHGVDEVDQAGAASRSRRKAAGVEDVGKVGVAYFSTVAPGLGLDRRQQKTSQLDGGSAIFRYFRLESATENGNYTTRSPRSAPGRAAAATCWPCIPLRYACLPEAYAASAEDIPGACCSQKIDFQMSGELGPPFCPTG